jgi:ABC-type transporter Mla MlaB component
MDSRTQVSTEAASVPIPLPLVLPAELTIYTVAELRPLWLTWLRELPAAADAASVAEVQAAAVDQVDAAGMQLLLSLERALAAVGRRCWLREPSSVLQAGCAALGLSAWMATHVTTGNASGVAP